jgi:putative ABC transport system ATP-binding protein
MTKLGGEWMLQARGLAKVFGARQDMLRATDGSSLLPMTGLADVRWRGAVCAVDEIDLDIGTGEMVAVMGPSGCGKSTLLHLLGGLERPTSGQMWLSGERVDALSERGLARLRRTSIGFVFQAFHLLEELTVAQNVELPALLAGRSPLAAKRRASMLLERVGLSGRARHLPSGLSGGERQRVAIARALSNEPLVVLADEPTGNLDSAATREALQLFTELGSSGQTVVIVTHDERIAAAADRVITMRDGVFTSEVRLAGRPARPVTGWRTER